MDAALKAMLTEVVTLAPVTGYDAFGVATYGAPVSRLARIQKRMVTIMGTAGRQIVTQTKIVVDGDYPILETDQLTMPDGQQPPIQGVETYKDAQGLLDHYTIVL
jgi:hypothetical protein